MDRERLERCLAQVLAYRASGLKASVWAEANGVSIRDLSSWCAHAQRWRARLDGVTVATSATKVGGFVAARLPARLPAPLPATVRIELCAGSARLALHWPVANARELAAWLREVGR